MDIMGVFCRGSDYQQACLQSHQGQGIARKVF
jgi:hypothetical protein